MYPELFPFFKGRCIDTKRKAPFGVISQEDLSDVAFEKGVLEILKAAGISSPCDLLLLSTSEIKRQDLGIRISNLKQPLTNWLDLARETIENSVEYYLEEYSNSATDSLGYESWLAAPLFNEESLITEDDILRLFPCSSASIHSLGLTCKVLHGLLSNNICSLAQLLACESSALTTIPYLGNNKLNKLKETTRAYLFCHLNHNKELAEDDNLRDDWSAFALFGGHLRALPGESAYACLRALPVSGLPVSTMIKNQLHSGGIHTIGSLLILNPFNVSMQCNLSANSMGTLMRETRKILPSYVIASNSPEAIPPNISTIPIGDFFPDTLSVVLPAVSASPRKICNTPVFFSDLIRDEGLPREDGIEVPVSELNISIRATNVLMNLQIHTFQQLLNTKIDTLEKSRGVGATTIDELKNKIKEYFHPTHMRINSSASLSDVVDSYFMRVLKKSELLVYKERIADENCTLESINEKLNLSVTRERVRQLLNTAIKKISRSSGQLRQLWDEIDDLLRENGYAMSADDLGADLATKHGWPPSSRKEIAKLLRLYSRWLFVDNTVACSSLPCFTCERLKDAVETFSKDSALDEPVDALLRPFRVDVCSHCEQSRPWNSLWFLTYFTRHEPWNGLHLENGRIMSSAVWEQRMVFTHASKRKLTEFILKNSQGDLSLNEIFTRYREIRPGDDISLSSIEAHCNGQEDIVLWGNGSYIHVSHIAVPVNELNEIASWIRARLDELNAPFISTDIAYKYFEQEMQRWGIPNGHALHGILRNYSANCLRCLRTPMVTRSEDDESPSLVSRIENHVVKHMSGTPLSKVQEFFCNKLGMKKHLFTSRWEQTVKIWTEGGFVHSEKQQLTVEKSKVLHEFISKTHHLLKKYPSISVTGMFANSRILCGGALIHSAHNLYTMLRFHAADRFSFPVYPYITRHGNLADINIRKELTQFLLDYGRPCNDEHIFDIFIKERGWAESSVRGALQDESIVTYVQGKRVHRDVIGLDDTVEDQLLELAKKEYESAKSRGEFAACIESLRDSDECPELDGVAWSQRLLSEVLHRSSEFLVLDSPVHSKVYVSTDNPDRIDSLGTLWITHLVKCHKGAERLDVFLDALWQRNYIFERNGSLLKREKRLSLLDGLVTVRREPFDRSSSEEFYDEDE